MLSKLIVILLLLWFFSSLAYALYEVKFMYDKKHLLFADYNIKMFSVYSFNDYNFNFIQFFVSVIPENATVIFESYSDMVFLSYFFYPRRLYEMKVNLSQSFLDHPESEFAIVRGGVSLNDGGILTLVRRSAVI